MRKLGITLILITTLLLGSVGVASAGPDGPKIGGEITEIDLTTGVVTLQNREGETYVIQFTDETEFHSRDDSLTELADLEIGMLINVRGEEQDDGTILAIAVAAIKNGSGPGERDGTRRLRGELTDIDGNLLTIQGRGGEIGSALVTADTEFHSRDGSVQSIEDLIIGQQIGIGIQQQDDGTLIAVIIQIGVPGGDNLPPDVVRTPGEIASVAADGSDFTLTSQQGETLTILVTADTKFHSRDGSLASAADLEVGMHVGIAAQPTDSGDLVALAVGRGKPPEERPSQVNGGNRPISIAKSAGKFSDSKSNN